MFNKCLFRSVIIREGLSASAVAHKLGTSTTTFYSKINGKTDFKVSEMRKIREILPSMTDEEAEKIFFAQ